MESIDTGLLLGRTRLRLSAHPGQFLFVELFFCEEEPRRAHPVPPLGEHSPGNCPGTRSSLHDPTRKSVLTKRLRNNDRE